MSHSPSIPRVIHSIGGLRVYDLCDGTISLVKKSRILGTSRAPAYSNLYEHLQKSAIHVIGVEFPGPSDAPPDFACYFPSSGFLALTEDRAWQWTRTAAISDQDDFLIDFSVRMTSYLRLLTLRIYQVSEAYAGLAEMSADIPIGHLFSNLWIHHVDAAIHAFLADAASFRDLIAEGVWRQVLKQDTSVKTLKEFRKRAKQFDHHLVKYILDSAGPDGWLKKFTDLRNNVIHVAPLSGNKRQAGCLAKEFRSNNISTSIPHYPIAWSNGDMYERDRHNFLGDESELRNSYEKFLSYCENSYDALFYVLKTLENLIMMGRNMRLICKYREEISRITQDDIIDHS